MDLFSILVAFLHDLLFPVYQLAHPSLLLPTLLEVITTKLKLSLRISGNKRVVLLFCLYRFMNAVIPCTTPGICACWMCSALWLWWFNLMFVCDLDSALLWNLYMDSSFVQESCNCIAHRQEFVTLCTHSPGPTFCLWLSKVSDKERRCYKCNISHQLRPCLAIDGKWALVLCV